MSAKTKPLRRWGKTLTVELERLLAVWVDVGLLDGSIKLGLEKTVNLHPSTAAVQEPILTLWTTFSFFAFLALPALVRVTSGEAGAFSTL